MKKKNNNKSGFYALYVLEEDKIGSCPYCEKKNIKIINNKHRESRKKKGYFCPNIIMNVSFIFSTLIIKRAFIGCICTVQNRPILLLKF